MKNTIWLILTAGFAMFSMFFGSGNLVFPIQIGVETTSAFPYASLGLLLTGVIIPFLGVLSLLVHRGTTHSYFALLGRIPGFIIVFMMLSLMGPFGVGARCIIVAYGGLQLVFENMPFLGFAIGFSVLTGLLTWKKNQIVSILGKYLTPILLVTIFILVIAGLLHAEPLEPFKGQRMDAFLNGLNQGYQTMDLLAAFFFSAAITEFFKNQLPNADKSKHVLQYGLAASCVGILLLAIVYFGFVKLGASYSDVLSTIAPEKKLVMIASLKLGAISLPLMAVMISFACLTTLVVLVMLFSDFLQHEITKRKLPRHVCLIITICLTFTTSLLGFDLLTKWIAASLSLAYPALIALAIAKIVKDIFGIDHVKKAFYITFVVYAAYSVLL